MKATIVECLMGVFGFGEANKLVDHVFFPKDPREIAEKLGKVEAGKVIEEIVTLVEKLQGKGYTTFVFESSKIAQNAREKLKIEVDVEKPSEAGELLRGNLEEFAVDLGFVKRAAELREWIHKVSMELTKARVRKAVEKRDLLVVQAIQTIDDLDKTLNLFMSRIREWYGLHFPELDRLIDKHETYARLIVNVGRKDDFTAENLEKEGLPKAKANQIAEIATASMGTDLNEGDMDQIQAMCKNTLELYDVRQSLEKYLDSAMDEVAPNTRALAGSLLGARLIALAGGLTNLAKLPASTVQVLGAEKALFRSLRTGTRPPKHGIIFQHSLIHEAKRWQRGKVARALAGKLTIAARIDAFSGKYAGDKLKVDLEKRIEEIKEKYVEPPPPKKPVVRIRPRRVKRGRRR
ncbi:MAG: C/D box methylation guide ribonucleoprotein complex aNOP56 subunit [Candidatus Bathyarchaeota archaeon]|nr:C/D box methylation guide ribonucleoprotein complex aNOP56 subunit [Candidatus Bathyarchaeota archaeon]MDH5635248.1 C/D box methylation guide ribonucleoprotein complex aNOP56 subunit [Candidatus Bathyarchaeota archaeon]MDH5701463.1 C/D box methylation guide ribonucleoprotein complex aNOP56 subunit [Candidatus Bathyarchaeota archaeon]